MDCPAMAMVLSGSRLSSVPPPCKPTEVGGDQDLPPAVPIDESLHVQPRVSDGDEPLLLDGGETCRRARVNTGDFGVPSLDTRQSYFSNSMPKRPDVPAAPNRILHNHHKLRIENMMKDLLPLLYEMADLVILNNLCNLPQYVHKSVITHGKYQGIDIGKILCRRHTHTHPCRRASTCVCVYTVYVYMYMYMYIHTTHTHKHIHTHR